MCRILGTRSFLDQNLILISLTEIIFIKYIKLLYTESLRFVDFSSNYLRFHKICVVLDFSASNFEFYIYVRFTKNHLKTYNFTQCASKATNMKPKIYAQFSSDSTQIRCSALFPIVWNSRVPKNSYPDLIAFFFAIIILDSYNIGGQRLSTNTNFPYRLVIEFFIIGLQVQFRRNLRILPRGFLGSIGFIILDMFSFWRHSIDAARHKIRSIWGVDFFTSLRAFFGFWWAVD